MEPNMMLDPMKPDGLEERLKKKNCYFAEVASAWALVGALFLGGFAVGYLPQAVDCITKAYSSAQQRSDTYKNNPKYTTNFDS